MLINLIQACGSGHLAIVERLLQDSRVDPSDNDNWAIIFASENGHSAIVERLLQDSRVDPSDDENLAIRWASQNGHSAIVECLLRDDRVDRDIAIAIALRNEQSEILLLPSLLPFVKRKDRVRQLIPHIAVKEEFVRSFEQFFTDAPPYVNKWVWHGGPGYHEGFEACFDISLFDDYYLSRASERAPVISR